METVFKEIKKTSSQKFIDDALDQGANYIKSGQLVAFPTETVYGIGANALNPQAVAKIFKAKGRPSDNPLIVHVDGLDLAKKVAKINDQALNLIRAFWPGPLTIIVPRKKIIPDIVTANLETVALRSPKNLIAKSLIKKSGCPIAAPSANISGKPSPTDGRHVLNDLDGKVAMILADGSSQVGLESTILDITQSPAVILRPGAITESEISKICKVETHLLSKNQKELQKELSEKPKAPGMKYRHYAPQGKISLIEGALLTEKYYKKKQKLDDLENKNLKLAVIGQAKYLQKITDDVPKYNLGTTLEDVAKNLFAALRWCDTIKADYIIMQKFPEQGIGVAIMNRLNKAASL